MYNKEYLLEPAEYDKKELIAFLNKYHLQYEDDIEWSVIIRNAHNDIIATASLGNNTIKCVAVDSKYEGEGLAAEVVTEAVNYTFSKGSETVFLFTSPNNVPKFEGMGFKLLGYGKPLYALLEYGQVDIKEYLNKRYLQYRKEIEPSAGIVVNCNPFTLGHKHLIETASKKEKVVYVFVVETERSLFPFNVRLKLVQKGTQEFDNVIVMPGGRYIISNFTFPTYFIRNEDDKEVVTAQTKLDVEVFARYIAPFFSIKTRYVAEEPYCPTTANYNMAMKEVLPQFDINLIEIPRKKTMNGEIISASTVRELIKQDNFEKIKDFVPKTTYEFLVSKEAESIINKIKHSQSRH